MKVWVQLKSNKHVERQGRLRLYRAGDWVDVGKQTAMLWISEGAAWIPEGAAADLMGADCGVIVWGNKEQGKKALGDYVGKIDIETMAPHEPPGRLPWSKTLLYNPHLRLRKELVPVGFHLLDTWQMAVPLYDYNKIAADQGGQEDRDRTAAAVPDLRVPLYSPDLLFLRRCGDVTTFLESWRADDVGDRRFSLLRAIYRTKPLILPLPTPWVNKDRM